ncbi:MAG: HEPN domain-containing protein [Caldilineaceae bacterium]|nr:HEPN domain-containing protein [Caldilineaceae bacterium]
MSGPELLAREAQRWLRFAAEDLAAAQRMLADRSSAPRHVCRHAQQATERALKAAPAPEGIDFPFTHDLNALRNLLPASWSVRTEHADLAGLTEWAVQTRYPGEWPIRANMG